MMHAMILETPAPDERKGQSEKAFSQCLARLTPADRDYYRRRLAQEHDAARAASCCEARMAHEELARAYRLLSSANDKCDETHLASEPAMFQFNPKPAD